MGKSSHENVFLPGLETISKCMGSCSSSREAPVFAGVQDWEASSSVFAILSMVLENKFGLSKSALIVLYTVSWNSHVLPQRCLVGIPIPRGGSVFWELGLNALCVSVG